jgi:hypothetical protein
VSPLTFIWLEERPLLITSQVESVHIATNYGTDKPPSLYPAAIKPAISGPEVPPFSVPGVMRVTVGVTLKGKVLIRGTPGRERSGGLVVQAAVRPLLVMLLLPTLGEPLVFRQVREFLAVEHLVSQPAEERLREGVERDTPALFRYGWCWGAFYQAVDAGDQEQCQDGGD